ncbi:MAG: hypothetical protein WDN44_05290 [Sphingomonas sp.]
MYKWVGGQSASTGMEMFDGWIGDAWQSPDALADLYAEPIVNIAGGYADYTPPPALEKARGAPKAGVALVGNPAKIGAATLRTWPSGVDRVALIDRRYVHERTRARVTELLARGRIAVDRVIVPSSQQTYLEAVARCEAIVNTQPYAAGLTAVEALALGVKLLGGEGGGLLFCARHHRSHQRTGGRNPTLPAQILELVSR